MNSPTAYGPTPFSDRHEATATVRQGIDGNSGQAMVELMVAMVAILALFAGLLQIASLSKTDTETMVEARRQAGQLAILDLNLLYDPEFIRDWEVGPDGQRHTRDDVTQQSSPVGFQSTIVRRAGRDASDWSVIDAIPDDTLTLLDGGSSPDTYFGLVKGEHSQSVAIIPAVRSLLYRADSIDVEATAWMTKTKGIY